MRHHMCLLLVLLPPTEVLAQYNPYSQQGGQPDARTRRIYRESAVAWAGPSARDFVEGPTGDEAAAALLACSPQVARKLAEAHTSLGKVPKPRDLLQTIGRYGDDAALWALQHHQAELMDVDNLDAFCFDGTLQYALGLKSIEEGGAQMRARRLAVQSAATPAPGKQWQVTLDAPKLAIIGGAVVVVLLLLWWRSRRNAGSL